MTKTFNIIITVVMIILVAAFIVSAISLQSKTDQILSTYSARREELAAKQLQIQDMIVALNSTLQSEIGKQNVIATRLGTKVNTTVSTPQPVINQPTPPPVVTNPAPQPVVTQPTPPPPVVYQPPPRVTRAS